MKSTLLREAIRVSYEKHDTHPMRSIGYTHFSFIIERNKILGVGMNNRNIEVPVHFGYDKRARGWNKDFVPCIHSELHAYSRCKGLIKDDFEIINVRITD